MKQHATSTFGLNGGMLILPEWRLFSLGIATLAIAAALELKTMPEVSGTIQPKSFSPWDFLVPQAQENGGLRVTASGTETVFEASESFDQRFGAAIDWPKDRQRAQTEERADYIPFLSPGLGAREAAGRPVNPSERGLTPLPPIPPANLSRKQLRIAGITEDSRSSLDADSHTAIYDIAAHMVYLPNGRRLEAHSGLGGLLDNPRYISEKDRGPTPPNVYDLTLRESLFHGVRAIRLTPVGDANMFGRDGMLAHSYMLGPNGQSNGCVSLRDYPAFLNAFLNGDINRLVVVEHLAATPSPKTASGWLPEPIKALFGRS